MVIGPLYREITPGSGFETADLVEEKSGGATVVRFLGRGLSAMRHTPLLHNILQTTRYRIGLVDEGGS